MPKLTQGPGLKFEPAANYAALSRRAADLICSELRRKPALLFCASAGATPTGLYHELALRAARRPALFSHFRLLQVDEWGGLPAGHPATCEADLKAKLVQPLRIAPQRCAGFNTQARDPQRECRRISAWLAAHGPIDLCILGLGLNGHIAMNEPAAELLPHPHVSTLAGSSLRHGMLKNLRPKPRYGLTLGMSDLLGSRRILLLVSGSHKREPLNKLQQPCVRTRFPASFLWLHPSALVLYDRDAARG